MQIAEALGAWSAELKELYERGLIEAADPRRLASASVLGHLLREIEGGLRALLTGDRETPPSIPDEAGEPSHRERIAAALGLSADDAVVRNWFRLARQLHRCAHAQRKRGAAPRNAQEVLELWRRFEDIMSSALGPFHQTMRELDELLAVAEPVLEHADRVASVLVQPAQRVYFFSHIQREQWVRLLDEAGFFAQPPEPHLPWPESQYLARMAGQAPEDVLEVALEVPETDNARVHQDLAEAACAMPAELAARWAEKEAEWVADQEELYLLLPERLGALLSHLAKGGQEQAALKLARSLLGVLPDPRMTEDKAEQGFAARFPEARGRFRAWHYERILNENGPDLVDAAGMEALSLLLDLLDQAIRLSVPPDHPGPPEDYSYVWREAIEDEAEAHHGLKDVLVSAVRDQAERLAKRDPTMVGDLVASLEARGWRVFQRLALHLLRRFPDAVPELVVERLTDPALFDEPSVLHEYYHLQKECFRLLSEDQQRRVLGWIEEGPDRDEYRARQEQWTGEPPTDEQVERYAREWQLRRLAPLAEHLACDWRRRYDELVQELGEPEFPDRLVHMGKPIVGPSSPKMAAEIEEMLIPELVGFLRQWQPTGEWDAPSPTGLALELSRAVAEEPAKFAAEARAFENVHATYVYGLIRGLVDACKGGAEFDWGPVLDLCEWAVQQPRAIEVEQQSQAPYDEGFHTDWGAARQAIAELLAAGFEQRGAELPFTYRDKAWAILEPLTDDPDPTPEREALYDSAELSAFSIAINAVRGWAMNAVVQYALWYVRNTYEKPADRAAAHEMQELPEVAQVLEKHLDREVERSLGIRSVYGRWLPWLVLLDRRWVERKLLLIFPPEREPYRRVAWDAYVTFCPAYDDVFEVLKEQYATAVAGIRESRAERAGMGDPHQHLAEHLMVLFGRGKISLDDPLMARFWQDANDELRAHAIGWEGHRLERTEEQVPEAILERLGALWERRLESAAQRPDEHRQELISFGWWFAANKFDAAWSVKQLMETLRLAKWVEPDGPVVAQLAKLAADFPREAVECLRLMVEGDVEGWHVSTWQDDARRVLRAALDGQDGEAQRAAEDLVNRLLARGYFDFRELLE